MSRIQLALNVANIEESIEFYSKLFSALPHKRRDGYANFVIEEPKLKLVLIENAAEAGTLNHLGVEVDTTDEVHAAAGHLAATGLDTTEELNTVCCYARQDKIWVEDPAGLPWEVYTVTDDSPERTVASTTCCTDEGLLTIGGS